MARKTNVNRRGFLSGVAAASGGAVAAVVPNAKAAEAPKVAPPTAAATAADTEPRKPAAPSTAHDCGSDFMVDVLKATGIEYAFANTAAGFLGLQESVINYAGNTSPAKRGEASRSGEVSSTSTSSPASRFSISGQSSTFEELRVTARNPARFAAVT